MKQALEPRARTRATMPVSVAGGQPTVVLALMVTGPALNGLLGCWRRTAGRLRLVWYRIYKTWAAPDADGQTSVNGQSCAPDGNNRPGWGPTDARGRIPSRQNPDVLSRGKPGTQGAALCPADGGAADGAAR